MGRRAGRQGRSPLGHRVSTQTERDTCLIHTQQALRPRGLSFYAGCRWNARDGSHVLQPVVPVGSGRQAMRVYRVVEGGLIAVREPGLRKDR